MGTVSEDSHFSDWPRRVLLWGTGGWWTKVELVEASGTTAHAGKRRKRKGIQRCVEKAAGTNNFGHRHTKFNMGACPQALIYNSPHFHPKWRDMLWMLGQER